MSEHTAGKLVSFNMNGMSDKERQAMNAKLMGILDEQLKDAYISHQQHEESVNFLKQVEQARLIRAKECEAKPPASPFSRLLGWNEDSLRMECLNCQEPVTNMKLRASVSIDMTWVDADELMEKYGCDEWTYSNVALICPCGVVIPTNATDSLSGLDFTFELQDDYWVLTVPKPQESCDEI